MCACRGRRGGCLPGFDIDNYNFKKQLRKDVLQKGALEDVKTKENYFKSKENPSKTPVNDLFWKVAGFHPANLLKMNSITSLFKYFNKTISTPYFRNSSLLLILNFYFLSIVQKGASNDVNAFLNFKFITTQKVCEKISHVKKL